MSRSVTQRGEGKLGCLVGLVLLALAGLAAYRLIPLKVKTADLRDTVIDEARSAGTRDDNGIRQAIYQQAVRLELPVTPEQIQIRRANAYVYVVVDYTVPVEFPGFTYDWNFHHEAENPIF